MEYFASSNTDQSIVARFVSDHEGTGSPDPSELRRIAPITLSVEAYRAVVEVHRPGVAPTVERALALLDEAVNPYPATGRLYADFVNAVRAASRPARSLPAQSIEEMTAEDLRGLLDARATFLSMAPGTLQKDAPADDLRNALTSACTVAIRHAQIAPYPTLFQHDLEIALGFTGNATWNQSFLDDLIVSAAQDFAAEAIEYAFEHDIATALEACTSQLQQSVAPDNAFGKVRARAVSRVLGRAAETLRSSRAANLLEQGAGIPIRAEQEERSHARDRSLNDVETEYVAFRSQLEGNQRRLYEQHAARFLKEMREELVERLTDAQRAAANGEGQQALSALQDAERAIDMAGSPIPHAAIRNIVLGDAPRVERTSFEGITSTLERAYGLVCVDEHARFLIEVASGASSLSPAAERARARYAVLGEPPTDTGTLREYCYLVTEAATASRDIGGGWSFTIPPSAQARWGDYQRMQQRGVEQQNELGPQGLS